MFSYLRPHKRSGSNPTSPNPISATHYQLPSSHSPAARHEDSTLLSPPSGPVEAHSPSPVSPFPPILPPIPRVASQDKGNNRSSRRDSADTEGYLGLSLSRTSDGLSNICRQPSQSSPPPYNPIAFTERPGSGNEDSQRSARSIANIGAKGEASRSWSRDRSPSHGVSRSTDAAYWHESPSGSPVPGGTALVAALPEPIEGVRAPPRTSQGIPSQAPKASKRKLALGNPMSLLMRRRSTQALERLSDESLISSNKGPPIPPMTMPDNYDPRIRGKFVHDFSAPRPRRNFSYNDSDSQEHIPSASNLRATSTPQSEDGSYSRRPQSAGRYSPSSHEREHTPIFREHFEEETILGTRQSAIRAEELANSNFLARNANLVSDEDLTANLSPNTRQPPPPPVPLQGSSPSGEADEAAFGLSSQLPTVVEASPAHSPMLQHVVASRSPPKTRSRAPSATDSTVQPTRQPKHHASNSSRFSFQMMDKDSIAQEKLLEEKHRQQVARKQQERPSGPPDPYEEGMEDMDEYDEMEDGGIYEEAIPGVNADADDDDFERVQQPSSLGALGISLSNMHIGAPISPLSSHSDVEKAFLERADDRAAISGQPGGSNIHSETGNASPIVTPIPSTTVQLAERFARGGDNKDSEQNVEGETQMKLPASLGFGSESMDDMYFDDGLIDEPGINDDETFDESVFDDPSHPLYERRPVVPSSEPQGEVVVPDVHQNLPLEPVEEESLVSVNASTNERTHGRDRDSLNVPHNSVKGHRTSDGHIRRASGPHLPGNDLAAYHSALAEAAQRAAADGKFAWHDGANNELSDGLSERDDAFGHSSRPSLIPDDGRFSQDSNNLFTPSRLPSGVPSLPPKGFEETDYETDEFDSYLEDDPIIAAANAEALASDDDGFYGQEFGFYAQAYGSSEAQFANGGYFGPRGVDALGRSISGRNAVREPNLTPITERSEFSTRNSFISVHGHWGPPSATSAAMPSPGVAQLARLSPYTFDEDEMSLSQLMKLRRGAFGGSNSSLHSASNSPNHSSPVTLPAGAAKGSSPMAPSVSAPGTLGLAAHGNNPDGLSPGTTTSRHGSQSLHGGGSSPLALPISDLELFDPDSPSPSPSPLSRNSPTITLPPAGLGSSGPPPPIPEQSISEESEEEVAEAERADANSPLPPPPPPSSSLNIPASSSPLANVVASPTSPPAAAGAVLSPPHSASRKPAHSRSGSTGGGGGGGGGTADRLTYVHEAPASSNGYVDRWVLERRRTAETGELELVGREIVSGGRI